MQNLPLKVVDGPPKGVCVARQRDRSHARRARQGLWKRRDSRVYPVNRCRATPPSARTGLIDDSERRTLAIISPVVKQAKCHLGSSESNIENKGLMDALGPRDRTLWTPDPIPWIESIQEFEPDASLLYWPRHAPTLLDRGRGGPRSRRLLA